MTTVRSRCHGLLYGSGNPIRNSDGWYLLTMLRWSLNDPDSGDVTVVDFPIAYEYSDFAGPGSISLESTSAEQLVPLLGVEYAGLPSCTNAEVVRIMILSPGDLPFAVPGFSTRAG